MDEASRSGSAWCVQGLAKGLLSPQVKEFGRMQKLRWEGFFGARLWMTLKATFGDSNFTPQSI